MVVDAYILVVRKLNQDDYELEVNPGSLGSIARLFFKKHVEKEIDKIK